MGNAMSEQPSFNLIVYDAYDTENSGLMLDLAYNTAWITQKQMSGLLGTDVKSINKHIRNFKREYKESANSHISNFEIVTADGKTRTVEHYDMTVVLYVGFRSQMSERVIRFQKWAGDVLNRFVVDEVKRRYFDPKTYRQLRSQGHSHDEALVWHDADNRQVEAHTRWTSVVLAANGDIRLLTAQSTKHVIGQTPAEWKREHGTKESPRRYGSAAQKMIFAHYDQLAADVHKARNSQGSGELSRDLRDVSGMFNWEKIREAFPDVDYLPESKPKQRPLLGSGE